MKIFIIDKKILLIKICFVIMLSLILYLGLSSEVKAWDRNTDITEDMIESIPDQIYKGSSIEPPVTVTDNYKVLIVDLDYNIYYQNNVNVGEATATLEGIGDYSGIVVKWFTIIPKKLTEDMIESIPDQIYTGSSIEPSVVVKDGNNSLTQGIDYQLKYKNNINTGEAMITVEGIGNYSGIAHKKFKIIERVIENKDFGITISGEIFKGSILSIKKLSEDSDLYKRAVSFLENDKEIFSGYEINFVEKESFSGKLTVIFNIGEIYNGQKVWVQHLLLDKSIETSEVEVKDGRVEINVQELGDFILAKYKVNEPVDPGLTKNSIDNKLKLGDSSIILILYIIVLAGFSGIGISLTKKKNNN